MPALLILLAIVAVLGGGWGVSYALSAGWLTSATTDPKRTNKDDNGNGKKDDKTPGAGKKKKSKPEKSDPYQFSAGDTAMTLFVPFGGITEAIEYLAKGTK